jgi:hypothetical protein
MRQDSTRLVQHYLSQIARCGAAPASWPPKQRTGEDEQADQDLRDTNKSTQNKLKNRLNPGLHRDFYSPVSPTPVDPIKKIPKINLQKSSLIRHAEQLLSSTQKIPKNAQQSSNSNTTRKTRQAISPCGLRILWKPSALSRSLASRVKLPLVLGSAGREVKTNKEDTNQREKGGTGQVKYTWTVLLLGFRSLGLAVCGRGPVLQYSRWWAWAGFT